ncbi:hypothetical protein SAMN05421693_13613 [Ectothiorhodospira magna]|uniref:Uncharacterized protein n=1 Tax=Ectothiorhodospira magna TaxID=867345 RepID=A0A1H9GFQ0_9GAMM|nr:hypothetical protein SAMN05421693_13613 [Ectothiorhodospira magna]
MASVGFLTVLIVTATIITTLCILVLLGLVIRDWRNGTLW